MSKVALIQANFHHMFWIRLAFYLSILLIVQFSLQVSHSIYGSEKKIILIPDGENMPVTNENCYRFVELYVDSILNKSVERQFAAFKKGFYQVCFLQKPRYRTFTLLYLSLGSC